MPTYMVPISKETGIKGQELKLVIAAQMDGSEYTGYVATATLVPPGDGYPFNKFCDTDGAGLPGGEEYLWQLLLERGGLEIFINEGLGIPLIHELTQTKIKQHKISEEPIYLNGHRANLGGGD